MTRDTRHIVATLLTHEDADTRRLAAEGLARAKERPVLAALCMALEDQSKGVRDAAIRSLIQIGGRSVARAIVYHIADSDIVMRNLAAKILVGLGEHAIPAILPYLKDTDKDVRKFGVDILGAIGGENVVGSLLPLLRDEDPNVRVATIEALGNIRSYEATVSLCELLVTDETVQGAVADALKNIGDARARIFLTETFCELIKNDNADPMSLYSVTDALAVLGDQNAQREIMTHFSRIGGTIRLIALHAIIEIGERERLPLDLDRTVRSDMVRGLTAENEQIQLSCVKGLSTYEDSEITLAFLDALGQTDDLDFALFCQLANRRDALRCSIAWLEQTPAREGKEVIGLLGKLVSDLIQPYSREGSAALDSDIVHRFFRSIEARWGASSESAREMIVETMFALDADRASVFLAHRLPCEDPYLQVRLLEQLGASANAGARDFLVHVLTSPDDLVREAAEEALRRIEMETNL